MAQVGDNRPITRRESRITTYTPKHQRRVAPTDYSLRSPLQALRSAPCAIETVARIAAAWMLVSQKAEAEESVRLQGQSYPFTFSAGAARVDARRPVTKTEACCALLIDFLHERTSLLHQRRFWAFRDVWADRDCAVAIVMGAVYGDAAGLEARDAHAMMTARCKTAPSLDQCCTPMTPSTY